MTYTSQELPKLCDINKEHKLERPIYVCLRCNKNMCKECWDKHFPCYIEGMICPICKEGHLQKTDEEGVFECSECGDSIWKND